MAKKQQTKLSDLIPDDKNFNKGSEFGNSLIEKSFRKFGAGRSILIDKNNRIIAGNKSVENAAAIGMDDLQIVESDGKRIIAVKRTDIDLDTPEGRELALADNASAKANIIFDAELIEAELSEAVAVEWGIEPSKKLEAEEDDFNGVAPKDPITVLCDLFEIGEHRLLCGDSTDSDAVAKLMDGQKADMVFTSPPYNGNTDADRGGKKNMKGLYLDNETDNKTTDEYLKFNEDIFNTIYLILADNGVILYNINYNKNTPSAYIDIVYSAKDKFNLVETIIWEKQMAVSLQGNNLTRIYEFIFVLFNGNDKPKLNKEQTECEKNLWKISNIGANTENHSACFPVALVDKAINLYAKKNALLYEPFTGSGTTMVASHQLNRKCYGMELDPKYCDVIVARMIKLDAALPIKRNGQLLSKDELNKFIENTNA